MSMSRWILAPLCAALIASCVTPESSARFAGLSPVDIAAITVAVRKQTRAPILGYSREDDGTIIVSTDGGGFFDARKIQGKWKVKRTIILT
jgi:hypothetical protein